MKGLYLLIKTGYEGIEDLILPTMDKQEAIDKIQSLRKEIEDAKKYCEEHGLVENVDAEDYSSEMNRLMNLQIESKKNNEMYRLADIDPDFYCIQQFDGDAFNCVCEELGLSPTKFMLR